MLVLGHMHHVGTFFTGLCTTLAHGQLFAPTCRGERLLRLD